MNKKEREALVKLLNYCEELLAAIPFDDYYGHPSSLYRAADAAREAINKITNKQKEGNNGS